VQIFKKFLNLLGRQASSLEEIKFLVSSHFCPNNWIQIWYSTTSLPGGSHPNLKNVRICSLQGNFPVQVCPDILQTERKLFVKPLGVLDLAKDQRLKKVDINLFSEIRGSLKGRAEQELSSGDLLSETNNIEDLRVGLSGSPPTVHISWDGSEVCTTSHFRILHFHNISVELALIQHVLDANRSTLEELELRSLNNHLRRDIQSYYFTHFLKLRKLTITGVPKNSVYIAGCPRINDITVGNYLYLERDSDSIESLTLITSSFGRSLRKWHLFSKVKNLKHLRLVELGRREDSFDYYESDCDSLDGDEDPLDEHEVSIVLCDVLKSLAQYTPRA